MKYECLCSVKIESMFSMKYLYPFIICVCVHIVIHNSLEGAQPVFPVHSTYWSMEIPECSVSI